METALIAYFLAWAATSAYVAWLVVQNARLATRQQELQKTWKERDTAIHPSKAA